MDKSEYTNGMHGDCHGKLLNPIGIHVVKTSSPIYREDYAGGRRLPVHFDFTQSKEKYYLYLITDIFMITGAIYQPVLILQINFRKLLAPCLSAGVQSPEGANELRYTCFTY